MISWECVCIHIYKHISISIWWKKKGTIVNKNKTTIKISFRFPLWSQINTPDIHSDTAQIKTNVQTPAQHSPHGTLRAPLFLQIRLQNE